MTAAEAGPAQGDWKGQAAILLRRVRSEFLEMPGLRLTAAQAARLWAVDRSTSEQILQRLTEHGFLYRNPRGAYLRLTAGDR